MGFIDFWLGPGRKFNHKGKGLSLARFRDQGANLFFELEPILLK